MSLWSWIVPSAVLLGGCGVCALAGFGVGWVVAAQPALFWVFVGIWTSASVYFGSLVGTFAGLAAVLRRQLHEATDRRLARWQQRPSLSRRITLIIGLTACTLLFALAWVGLLGDPTRPAAWAMMTGASYLALAPSMALALLYHRALALRDAADPGPAGSPEPTAQ